MGYLTVAAIAFILAFVSFSFAKDPIPKGTLEGTGHTIGFGEMEEEWRGEIIHLSWEPRAFLLKGFLSDEECDHLIKKSENHMQKSTVVDSATGKSKDSDVRTSLGSYFPRGHDSIIKTIENRVAQVSMLPVENQEAMQILKYENGQKYEPHNDYFHDTENAKPEAGGQRVITVLMYLSTVEEGGETVFPLASEKVKGSEWSDCAKKGLAVKTYKGDALLFYSLKSDGSLDPKSLHGSCPTTKGTKWSATKWIRVSSRPG